MFKTRYKYVFGDNIPIMNVFSHPNSRFVCFWSNSYPIVSFHLCIKKPCWYWWRKNTWSDMARVLIVVIFPLFQLSRFITSLSPGPSVGQSSHLHLKQTKNQQYKIVTCNHAKPCLKLRYLRPLENGANDSGIILWISLNAKPDFCFKWYKTFKLHMSNNCYCFCWCWCCYFRQHLM